MNTRLTWQTRSTCLEDTLKLGTEIGSRLKGGEVIELLSDMGGGKTSFVRGLALGAGSKDHVHSPTFTLTNEYKGGKNTIFHLDLYRLQDPGIVKQEIEELVAEHQGIIVVEWAKIVDDALPADRVSATFRVDSENERSIVFEYPPERQYLFPNT